MPELKVIIYHPSVNLITIYTMHWSNSENSTNCEILNAILFLDPVIKEKNNFYLQL